MIFQPLIVKALVSIALIVGAVSGFQWYIGGVRDAADKTGYERARGEYAKQAFVASEHARKEEARREAGLKEIVNGSREELGKARAAAAAGAATADRLRVELAAARRRACTQDTSTASGGASADALPDLLAELQRRADDVATELARHADEARIAGSACERAYDALTPR